MWYCKNAGGDLAKSIADAEKRGRELTAEIEASIGKLAQLKEDVKSHQIDRAAAKADVHPQVQPKVYSPHQLPGQDAVPVPLGLQATP